MKIQVYHIIINNWKEVVFNAEWLLNEINKQPLSRDSDNWEYGIVESYMDKNYIYGYIVQESDEELVKYTQNKNMEDINDNRWEKTFFILDTKDGKFFIHKRRYTPTNLNHQMTMSRLSALFGKIFFKEYYSTVEFFPYKSGINNEEFKSIFYSNKIVEIEIHDIYGHYVSLDADLHNPRKEWDKYRAESHNTYDAKIIRSAYLEANRNKDLSKSPTARTFVESGATGEKISYLNSQGEVITEGRESNAMLELKLKKRPNDYEAKDIFIYLKKFIAQRQNQISKFRLYQYITEVFAIQDRIVEVESEKEEVYDEKDN